MIHKSTFNFLSDLGENNNKEWFYDNKSNYQKAKENFIDYLENQLKGICEFDYSVIDINPKSYLFRITRDTRFSKDKSPYNTFFGAHIVPGGRKNEQSKAGYYIQVGPSKSMLASGAYRPNGQWLNVIRKNISNHGEILRTILKEKKFKGAFGYLEGEKLKRAPQGYDIDHPEIDLLKYKSYLIAREYRDSEVLDVDFSNKSIEMFKLMYPFKSFLNAENLVVI